MMGFLQAGGTPDVPAFSLLLIFLVKLTALFKSAKVIGLGAGVSGLTNFGLVGIGFFVLAGLVGCAAGGVGRLKRGSFGRSCPTPVSGATFGNLEGGSPYNPN